MEISQRTTQDLRGLVLSESSRQGEMKKGEVERQKGKTCGQILLTKIWYIL